MRIQNFERSFLAFTGAWGHSTAVVPEDKKHSSYFDSIDMFDSLNKWGGSWKIHELFRSLVASASL